MTRRALDVDALHVALWIRSAPRRTLRVNKTHLAAELRVSRFTMHKTIDEMLVAGRLKPIGNSFHYPLFRVADPAEWADAVRAADGADEMGS